MGLFDGLFRKQKYGEPVVIVSGLPRSGTSMMMKMLEAGGLAVQTDNIREPDIDNPKGYYEDERVKDLEKVEDKSWVRESRGKVLKVISFLLKDLPEDNHYKVVFMRRNLQEIMASQNKMIDRLGSEDNTDDEQMLEIYRSHIATVKIMGRKLKNMDVMEIRYDDTISNPEHTATVVNEFLGGKLDTSAMKSVVDGSLYRNRR
jgi:hypothetical protein